MLIFALIPGVHQVLSIPSSNAFLFSLAPFKTSDGAKKLKVLPEKRHLATRSFSGRGPCWGKDIDELCFNDQQVNTEISSSGVYDVSGISDPGTYFTGESSFLVDDIEVFTIAGENVNYSLNYS